MRCTTDRQTESINPGVLSTCAWSHLLPLIEEVPHSQQASQEVPEGGTAPQLVNSTLDVHHRISKLLQDRGGGGGEGGAIQYNSSVQGFKMYTIPQNGVGCGCGVWWWDVWCRWGVVVGCVGCVGCAGRCVCVG